MSKVYYLFDKLARGSIFVSALFSLYTIIKFTKLNILYLPQENPLIFHEYTVLLAVLGILLLTIFFKMRHTKIIAALCVALSVFNIFILRMIS